MSRFAKLGSWAEHAACLGTPMAWWYPEDRHGFAEVEVVPPQAAERCASCPVRRECASHALRHEEFGVWAGMSEEHRRRARSAAGIRRTNQAPSPSPKETSA